MRATGTYTPEERLLRPEDLHGGRGLLREADERPRMSDQPSPDELPDEDRQVGRNGSHPALEVVKELPTVLRELYHLCGHMRGSLCT